MLHLLKGMVNPWRVPYFKKTIYQTFGENLQVVHLLDTGSGDGLLTEEFNQMYLQVRKKLCLKTSSNLAANFIGYALRS